MNNEMLIDVLWVEDQTSIWDSYKAEAELEGLRLHPFASWEEAETQLKENYGKWSAIILDAKCKVKKDDSDGVDFLIPVLQELRGLAERFHHTIPWFVLSGDIDESDIINKYLRHNQREWDLHLAPFYDKNTDTEELWSNILVVAEKSRSHELAITQDLYREVFESLDFCNLNSQVKDNLINLLLPIHFGDNQMPNDSYQKIRISIEYIFRSMIEMRILPKNFINNGKVNLTYCCYFLQNRTDKCKDYNIYETVMSDVLATNIKFMIDVTGSKLHSEGADEAYSKDIWQYEKEVGNRTNYLLRSFTYQLCDIILWYANYLRAHDNPIENSQCWAFVKKEDALTNISDENIYDGKEMSVEYDENGIAHCQSCMLPPQRGENIPDGSIVKLKKVQINSNRETRNKYPYFAKYDIINK